MKPERPISKNDLIRLRQIFARLDRLPIWPYPRFYLLIVGIGFFFSFYDILTIGLALPRIETEFGVSLAQASWTITSSLIGYIIGSFVLSRLADNAGRKVSLLFSILFFTVGSFACAASFHLLTLIFWRFITGIGIGAEIAVVTTYVSELAPARVRGKAVCAAIAYGMFGFAISPFIAYFLVPNFTFGWRILFLTGGIGGIFIYFSRRYLPDSPRWLGLHRQLDRADGIVSKAENFAAQSLPGPLPSPAVISLHPVNSDTSLQNFLQPTLFKRTIQFILIWFTYYIGNYAWLTLATSLFVSKGFTIASSIGFVALASFGFIVGSIISMIMSERWERKWSAIIILIIWAIALSLIGYFPNPIVIIIAGFIATTTIATLIPILYVYTSENFPTRIRTTGLSITDGLGHLGGAFCAQIVFWIGSFVATDVGRFQSSFMVMAVTGVITALLLLPGLKMTKQSLGELAKY